VDDGHGEEDHELSLVHPEMSDKDNSCLIFVCLPRLLVKSKLCTYILF
jgi:hypothetical protein